MDNSIKITGLTKRFGSKTALDNIDLDIPQGMFGLLGPNGAGKTTLMKIISTLLKKNDGDVSVCGIPVENTRDVRKIIGYLPQDFSMYANMTAYDALDYLATLSGMNKTDRRIKVPETLEKVNLLDQRKTRVKSMSGGMQRRLGIAQATIHDPRVIIVDEPTVGLDPEARVRFRNMLCEIARDRVVLLSTHIVGDIEISTSELESVKERYLVTGILTSGSLTTIKLISDEKPFESATNASADVEDAYMYIMHRQEAI